MGLTRREALFLLVAMGILFLFAWVTSPLVYAP